MKRALIVDDNEAMLKFLAKFLTAESFAVDQAIDAISAMEQVNNNPPYDLITVDWNMPGQQGIDLIKVLRTHKHAKAAKIFMVTANQDQKSVEQAKANGADDYIMKPFSPQVIIDIIQLHFSAT